LDVASLVTGSERVVIVSVGGVSASASASANRGREW